eukprot:m.102891 g.102891  ORF g.102891 m.102891 type:complete len:263 (+) comp13228_c0_seq8:195-983(+)
MAKSNVGPRSVSPVSFHGIGMYGHGPGKQQLASRTWFQSTGNLSAAVTLARQEASARSRSTSPMRTTQPAVTMFGSGKGIYLGRVAFGKAEAGRDYTNGMHEAVTAMHAGSLERVAECIVSSKGINVSDRKLAKPIAYLPARHTLECVQFKFAGTASYVVLVMKATDKQPDEDGTAFVYAHVLKASSTDKAKVIVQHVHAMMKHHRQVTERHQGQSPPISRRAFGSTAFGSSRIVRKQVALPSTEHVTQQAGNGSSDEEEVW